MQRRDLRGTAHFAHQLDVRRLEKVLVTAKVLAVEDRTDEADPAPEEPGREYREVWCLLLVDAAEPDQVRPVRGRRLLWHISGE